MATEKNPRVCLLTGNYFERQEMMQKIYQALGEFERYTADEEWSWEYFRQQISEALVSGKKKLIVMNDWPDARETKVTLVKNFAKLLPDIPVDCVLVINNVEVPDEVKNWTKSHGRVFEFKQYLPLPEAPDWIIAFCQKRGRTIDSANAAMITRTMRKKEKAGVNVDEVITSLLRLEHYMGSRKNVTKDDVSATCFDSTDFVIWNLFYALDAKDLSKALSLLNKVWTGSHQVDKDISGMIYSMIWRFRLLFILKEGFAKKWDKDRVFKELQQIYKLERKGSGFKTKMTVELNKTDKQPKIMYTPYLAEMMLNSYYGKDPVISKYMRKEIFIAIKVLEETLVRIRHGCSEDEAIMLFELVVCTICGAVRERDWRTFRNV